MRVQIGLASHFSRESGHFVTRPRNIVTHVAMMIGIDKWNIWGTWHFSAL